MPRPQPLAGRILSTISAFAMSIVFAAIMLFPAAYVHAQTFAVLHNFTNGSDGGYPYTGLTIDRAGNLYGTTISGGNVSRCQPFSNGCGVVFRLKPAGSGWVFSVLYSFFGGSDGATPEGRVIISPDGSLYGDAIGGGSTNCPGGCGVVFNLRPPATVCRSVTCPWTETPIYHFQGNSDAFYPSGDLAFDSAGAIYGTTLQGGTDTGAGTVYKLTPSGGSWTESLLFSFGAGNGDYGNPEAGVVLDSADNAYGTAPASGVNQGVVFEVTQSGVESVLHAFQGSDGAIPIDGVTFDTAGNLWGATVQGGANNGGVVYELTPSGSGWTFAKLFDFVESVNAGPYGKLMIDAAGNIYGTTQGNSSNGDFGTAFKLTHSSNGWTETILHRFTGGTDGSTPYSNLVMDANGNLYGTTYQGGQFGFGVVFEITP